MENPICSIEDKLRIWNTRMSLRRGWFLIKYWKIFLTSLQRKAMEKDQFQEKCNPMKVELQHFAIISISGFFPFDISCIPTGHLSIDISYWHQQGALGPLASPAVHGYATLSSAGRRAFNNVGLWHKVFRMNLIIKPNSAFGINFLIANMMHFCKKSSFHDL